VKGAMLRGKLAREEAVTRWCAHARGCISSLKGDTIGAQGAYRGQISFCPARREPLQRPLLVCEKHNQVHARSRRWQSRCMRPARHKHIYQRISGGDSTGLGYRAQECAPGWEPGSVGGIAHRNLSWAYGREEAIV